MAQACNNVVQSGLSTREPQRSLRSWETKDKQNYWVTACSCSYVLSSRVVECSKSPHITLCAIMEAWSFFGFLRDQTVCKEFAVLVRELVPRHHGMSWLPYSHNADWRELSRAV